MKCVLVDESRNSESSGSSERYRTEDFPMTGLKATRTGFRLQPLSRGGHIDQRTMISYPKPRVDMYGNEFKGGKGKF